MGEQVGARIINGGLIAQSGRAPALHSRGSESSNTLQSPNSSDKYSSFIPDMYLENCILN